MSTLVCITYFSLQCKWAGISKLMLLLSIILVSYTTVRVHLAVSMCEYLVTTKLHVRTSFCIAIHFNQFNSFDPVCFEKSLLPFALSNSMG